MVADLEGFGNDHIIRLRNNSNQEVQKQNKHEEGIRGEQKPWVADHSFGKQGRFSNSVRPEVINWSWYVSNTISEDLNNVENGRGNMRIVSLVNSGTSNPVTHAEEEQPGNEESHESSEINEYLHEKLYE